MGHSICFKGVIWKIISKVSLLPLLICSSAVCLIRGIKDIFDHFGKEPNPHPYSPSLNQINTVLNTWSPTLESLRYDIFDVQYIFDEGLNMVPAFFVAQN